MTKTQNYGNGAIMHHMINESKAPHSFEFGKPGSRHKVYYEDETDLMSKITAALRAEKYLAEQTILNDGEKE